MKKIVALFLVFTILLALMPVKTLAQCAEAQADAEKDVNPALWIGIGCLLSVVGVIIAYNMVAPSPPPSNTYYGEIFAVYSRIYCLLSGKGKISTGK